MQKCLLRYAGLLCFAAVVLPASHGCQAQVQDGKIILDRGGNTIVLEPYAPNIIRITLSTIKDQALAPPGYGFLAAPSPQGWTYRHRSDGDTYSSSRLTVTIPMPSHKSGKIPASQLLARLAR